uniref:F-box domain-containing protein n=1 Tax=Panagrolaimus sp. JU765 TaxID=591449 RepID=A0AC34REB8_9BILA
MEYFNFLGLPDVVQDLIVHEIVHNSIPNDRIQLARTCKYMNEAVKRAKPKKIVEKVTIDLSDDLLLMHFDSKSVDGKPSPTLVTKFVTNLKIYHHGFFPEFTEFYNKLEHLEFLDYFGSIEMFNSLSHLPSKIKVNILPDYDSSLLENITKKTENNPLSSLYLDDCIPVEDLQQFLQATKFKNGFEIHFEVQCSEFKVIHIFMNFIDDEQGFEIETFPKGSSLIVAIQKYDGKEKRILSLSVMELLTVYDPLNDAEPWRVPFNVTMKTQPTLPIFCDYLVDGEQDYVMENIKENDWIKINTDANVRYSNKMLESNFPRKEFATAQERLTFINDTLGCRISIIKVEELAETVQNLENG